jgi:chorismate synthase
MNTFGNRLRISIFGESHGVAVGVVMDGVTAGMELSEADFVADLARRQAGAEGTTARREADRPEIVSGLYKDRTTGAPLTVMFRNEDVQSADYEQFAHHPRPSHADFVASKKFGWFNDPRGGGHFSGRLTVALVAAGVVAKKMLGEGIRVEARVVETGDIAAARAAGDSVGGVVECVATGLPVGLGEPFFDSAESLIAHLLFAIPAVRGVEFGAGFAAARMRGSEHNDLIINEQGATQTNHAGGVVGGLTNGNPLIVRVAVKPAASIAREQETFHLAEGRVAPLSIGGRHDACIALRTPVIVEAAVAVALIQFF